MIRSGRAFREDEIESETTGMLIMYSGEEKEKVQVSTEFVQRNVSTARPKILCLAQNKKFKEAQLTTGTNPL